MKNRLFSLSSVRHGVQRFSPPIQFKVSKLLDFSRIFFLEIACTEIFLFLFRRLAAVIGGGKEIMMGEKKRGEKYGAFGSPQN